MHSIRRLAVAPRDIELYNNSFWPKLERFALHSSRPSIPTTAIHTVKHKMRNVGARQWDLPLVEYRKPIPHDSLQSRGIVYGIVALVTKCRLSQKEN